MRILKGAIVFSSRKVSQSDITQYLEEQGIGENTSQALSFAGCAIDGKHVIVSLQLNAAFDIHIETKRDEIEKGLTRLKGISTAQVVLTSETSSANEEIPPSSQEFHGKNPPLSLPNIRHIIAVASGKGGVGKSTMAVNIACALALQGQKVGLLDADVYGPSVPQLVGLADQGKPEQDKNKIVPHEKFGTKIMSMGFMVDQKTPMVWRGPMVQSAIYQMLRDVDWGQLDVLIVDMPPGTGDAQLTLAQKVPLSGAIIVSTPQDLALADAIKGIEMFQKVNVPILGLIENMSHFNCPHCGENTDIFVGQHIDKTAENYNINILGKIPLHPQLVQFCEQGTPASTLEAQDHAPDYKVIFSEIAQHLDIK